jgi:uncharacterized protein
MRRRLCRLAVGAALLWPAALSGQPVALNLMTGPPGGSLAATGADLAAEAAACGIDLGVQPSAGSMENALAVRDRARTQFGMVQADVLEYIATLQDQDADYRRAAQGLRVALPLYPAEVHVLARGDVGRLEDLAGRRVAVGAEGSGSAITAGLVLDMAGVADAERVALAEEAALEALAAGGVDAAVLVAPAPDPRLAGAGLAEAGIRLLPVEVPALRELYVPVTIAAGTYPFVARDVPGIAVRMVLVSYDFDPAANAYQAASCSAVAGLAHLALSRLDRLAAQGHPAWRGVDVSDLPPDWELSDCALSALAPGYRFACTAPSGGTVVETAPEADAARRAFFLERACALVECR